jgi:hypothetical protein
VRARGDGSDGDEHGLPAAIPLGFGGPPGLAMAKDTSGLWSVTTSAPFEPGTYRYNFRVDGARVPDPQATRFSHERVGTNSVLEVPGAEGAFQAYDPKIAHGVVSDDRILVDDADAKRRATCTRRRGYMKGSARYPVLYLVHGAGDSDDSWTSVGHANYILDNLIAAGKAKPMIVVMPFGHTPDRPASMSCPTMISATTCLKTSSRTSRRIGGRRAARARARWRACRWAARTRCATASLIPSGSATWACSAWVSWTRRS